MKIDLYLLKEGFLIGLNSMQLAAVEAALELPDAIAAGVRARFVLRATFDFEPFVDLRFEPHCIGGLLVWSQLAARDGGHAGGASSSHALGQDARRRDASRPAFAHDSPRSGGGFDGAAWRPARARRPVGEPGRGARQDDGPDARTRDHPRRGRQKAASNAAIKELRALEIEEIALKRRAVSTWGATRVVLPGAPPIARTRSELARARQADRGRARTAKSALRLCRREHRVGSAHHHPPQKRTPDALRQNHPRQNPALKNAQSKATTDASPPQSSLISSTHWRLIDGIRRDSHISLLLCRGAFANGVPEIPPQVANPLATSSGILSFSLFRCQARLRFSTSILKRLGEELNPNLDQGILELVKNAYDADALTCTVELQNTREPGGTLRVHDNGNGMTRKQIEEGWLVLGSSSKSVGQPTGLGRVPVGNKGLGRIAALRMGDVASLVTRPKAEPNKEYALDIEWERFNESATV